VNIPLASKASETSVKDLRQISNIKPGLEMTTTAAARDDGGVLS
jgi:hypothetical protein